METNRTRKTNAKVTAPAINLNYGKVPPHAFDIEQAILGAILLVKDAFEETIDIIKTTDCFYSEAHQKIFLAMVELNQASQPIDILTVKEQLRKKGQLEMVGDTYYLTVLTNSVVSSANLESHCKIVVQKYFQRAMIQICGLTLNEAYEDSGDAFEIIDSHEKKLTELSVSRSLNRITTIEGELVQAVKRIESRRNTEDHVTGIPSGFRDLDTVTHGWQSTDLIILAARPAVGKTAFALNLARNAALHPRKPVPVALFSLEMSTGQLIERLISAESEIFLEKIATGRLEEREMEQIFYLGIQKLADTRIFFDDTPALNVFELRAKCRRLKRVNDIGLIIIDYLQLMSGVDSKGNREQEISTISRGLKGLAKELKVPIIALSQLSREVEKRKGEGFMPKLSDLRESGAIEQDADMVMFMYRPEYHDINQNQMGESTSGETHIRIAKHRNGKLETIKLTAKLAIQKFVPFEAGFPAPELGGSFKSIGSRSFYEKNDDDITF
jgi:replicative DNA helicase